MDEKNENGGASSVTIRLEPKHMAVLNTITEDSMREEAIYRTKTEILKEALEGLAKKKKLPLNKLEVRDGKTYIKKIVRK